MRLWGLLIAVVCAGCGRLGFDTGAVGDGGGGDDQPGSTSDATDGSSLVAPRYQVAVNDSSAFALRDDGTLFGWGFNWYGELGLGNQTMFFATPQQLPGEWSRVWSGGGRSCAEDRASGDLYCWGNFQPTIVSTPTFARSGPILELSIAHYDTTMLTPMGAVQWFPGPTPTQIRNYSLASPTHVASAEAHSCVIDATGLLCEGYNISGQVGDGTKMTKDGPPYLLIAAGTWLSVSVGSAYSCAIRGDHTLWCWGSNDAGVFGQPTPAESLTPMQIGTQTDWTRVIAGSYHTCAERTDGTMWCAGSRRTDTLAQITGTDWQSFAAGSDFTCGVRSDEVWCWGLGNYGQLGQGDQNDAADFVRVPLP